MINPIDREFKSKLIERIPTKKIVARYKNDFQVDVSRYFSGIDFAEIYECEVTKYRYYYPFSFMGDGVFYIDLSKGKRNYYHERWEHKLALRHVNSGQKWLEVGSGNSYFLKELAKRGVKALGLELNSEEVLKAENEKFEVHDCDFFSFEAKNSEYDVIASFQVLEHIKDVSNYFVKAGELLRKNGKLIIGVPNSNPYLYVFDKFHTLNLPPHHMGLWTGKALKKVGEKFGFSLIKLQYEPISQSELDYILDLFSVGKISVHNLKFFILKAFRRVFPSKLYHFISSFCRKYLVNGRNILIVLEKKND
ncbi:class I SAM-dependent methyltransferase [Algoriphagus terrigena]|uniref:class I SAM-dependent methyltransferase n=1 Tax=Algoriphagus terrigena TaxID=344884 RepID=UPI00041B6143|nr:class I SAM-dependent methyltransferase [Algoriphagus terrigena]